MIERSEMREAEILDFLIGEVGERIRRLDMTPEELAAIAVAAERDMDPNSGDEATARNIAAFYELYADALPETEIHDPYKYAATEEDWRREHDMMD
jgi:hypothetical protein